MCDNEKTLFDFWQESVDEMWKRALDEDSDEEEFGTCGGHEFSCGGFHKHYIWEKEHPKHGLDHHLHKALGHVNGSILNHLGVMFDDVLLGLTPKEKTRNGSGTHPESPSLSKKSAATTSTPHKKHSSDGSFSLARSLSFRRNGSLRRNSGSFRSSEDRSERVESVRCLRN